MRESEEEREQHRNMKRIHDKCIGKHMGSSVPKMLQESSTPGSMNILFNAFSMEIWRGMLGGVWDYLSGMLEGFSRTNKGYQRQQPRIL